MRILWLLLLLLLCVHPSSTSAESSDQDEEVPLLIDLHAHSTLSDGSDTPLALVQRAVAAGVSVLAFTDHDQLSYDAEALEWARTHGLEIIQGTEISCEWTFHYPHTITRPKRGGQAGELEEVPHTQSKVHLLGYFTQASPPSSALDTLLTDLQAKRSKRNSLILQKLKDMFQVDISEQDVIDAAAQAAERKAKTAAVPVAAATASTSSIEYLGRPHIAMALVAAGHAESIGDAFSRYLSDEVLPLPAWSLEFGDALQALALQGAVPVLAHPTTIGLGLEEGQGLERELSWLLRHHPQGSLLKGLEVYSSKHRAGESQELLEMTHRLGLLATGGSDFHGNNKPHVPLALVGRGTDAHDSTRNWAKINTNSFSNMQQLRASMKQAATAAAAAAAAAAATVGAQKKATHSMSVEEWEAWARSDSGYISSPPSDPIESFCYLLVLLAVIALLLLIFKRRWMSKLALLSPNHASPPPSSNNVSFSSAAIDTPSSSAASRHSRSVNRTPSSGEESSSDDGGSIGGDRL